MNLKRHQAESPDINLTPLIDVVFLLLIFFMVSTTFKKDQSIAVVLPESSPSLKSQPLGISLEIIISADGRYAIRRQQFGKDGKRKSGPKMKLIKHDIRNLKESIKKMSGRDNTMKVAIRADAKSPHQAFVRAMDALGQLGFKKVSIVTVPPRK